MRKIVSLNLDVEMLKELDTYLSGRISRSSAINMIVRKFLDEPIELL